MGLDWLRSEPFDPLTLHAALQETRAPLKSVSFAPYTLIGLVKRTKVSLFAYPYPLLAPLRNWETYGVSIAAPEDLVCMELVAVQQRGSKRDFFDLYMLLQDIPLQRAVELYAQKYGVQPNASLAYALTYLEDADSEPTPRLQVRLSWRTVKRFMQQQALALLRG
ncbi:MAG: nucleotidyl transferase AbiEii/AbiGii toxin family protein [Fimbriimonadales bacterium]|nr:nucleotidyl transferase AbiEii/AbiGii toxin family protein [Fimbriimonadales bacterium]MDW8052287.1 nucleotidyl transferase AbiEii/AbiGii toxin family protein [Armatimonadota bacterium]